MHIVHDQEDRFEVTYWDKKDQKRKVLNRTGTIEGAEALCSTIKVNPAWGHPHVRDRDRHPDQPTLPPRQGPPVKRSYE
jgi:hypothetical protein